jgi:V/A-type H+-transporting ATPase subunit F
MYKIGVIGDSASVLGFMAIGFGVFPVESAEEARKTIVRLANDNYAILYITENFAMECEETIARYKDTPLPAVITIPGKDGAKGYGLANIKRSVERAVGADILFKEE